MRVLALLLICTLAGCRRPPADSPQFAEAFALYNQLYARSLDDAYGDPQMARVAALLAEVDPRASQAAEAKELLAKVQAGMDAYQADARKVATDQKTLDSPVRFEGLGGGLPPPTPKAAPADATGPALGMSRDDFTAKFGDCFERRGDYEQGDKRGEAFGLLPVCAARYPPFADSLVVLFDNKIRQLVSTKEVSVRTVDAGPAPVAAPAGALPAGAPAVAPAGLPVGAPTPSGPVLPPAANAPTTVHLLPGMPLPANAVVPLPPPAE